MPGCKSTESEGKPCRRTTRSTISLEVYTSTHKLLHNNSPANLDVHCGRRHGPRMARDANPITYPRRHLPSEFGSKRQYRASPQAPSYRHTLVSTPLLSVNLRHHVRAGWVRARMRTSKLRPVAAPLLSSQDHRRRKCRENAGDLHVEPTERGAHVCPAVKQLPAEARLPVWSGIP